MTEALIVSNVVLWIAVVGLCAVVAALTRQIGLLHERIAPVGALARSQGPAIGEAAPELEVHDLDGHALGLGGPSRDGRRVLLFFLSPGCPICETLLPTVRRLAADEDLRLVVASDGAVAEHQAFRKQHGLEDTPYVLSRELGLAYQVAQLPHAALIDAAGILRGRGLVNTREHVESLLEAERLGVASVQDYLSKEQVR